MRGTRINEKVQTTVNLKFQKVIELTEGSVSESKRNNQFLHAVIYIMAGPFTIVRAAVARVDLFISIPISQIKRRVSNTEISKICIYHRKRMSRKWVQIEDKQKE